jgi:hypothetical protein
MSDVCFHEMIGFEPTRRVYDEFARARTDALVALIDDAGVAGRRVPASFLAEIVKVALDSMCAREFEAETGIEAATAVEHLLDLVFLVLRRPPSGRGATPRRPGPARTLTRHEADT